MMTEMTMEFNKLVGMVILMQPSLEKMEERKKHKRRKKLKKNQRFFQSFFP